MKVAFGKTLEREINPSDFGFNGELSPVAQHIVYIGLRNIGMDSHANDTEDKHGADYITKAGETLDKKLEALRNGDVRAVSTRTSDPIAKQMRQLAFAKANEQLKAELGKASFKDMDSNTLTTRVNELLTKHDATFRKTATKMVKAASELKLDID